MQCFTIYFIWKLLYMLGWYHHPSSAALTTVSTVSGICHTVIAICRYRGRVGTGLSVLWVACATHSTLKWVAEGGYGDTVDIRRWFWWGTGCQKVVMVRLVVIRWLWWDTDIRKLLKREWVAEGGYREILGAKRWLWRDIGCQKEVIVRYWISECGYNETLGIRM